MPIENYTNINLYHGTSSASIHGVYNSTDPGLKPTDTQVQQNSIPYSGELRCIQPGAASRVSISFVHKQNMDIAARYANIMTWGWTPEEGKEDLSKAIADTENPIYTQERKDWAAILTRIERMRLAIWPQLPTHVQETIKDPFSVIYSTTYSGPAYVPWNARCHDIHISKTIPLTVLQLAVPKSKIPLARELANQTANIISFQDFAKTIKEDFRHHILRLMD